MKKGNPQGKGLTPVLDQWRSLQPAAVAAKPPRRILADYFTTLLVLSAEFRFKPAVGNNYHLYLRKGRWRLSLVAPAEWGARDAGEYLGRCELQADMTWRLDPVTDLDERKELTQALKAFHDGFVSLLDREEVLEDSLPFYVRDLPYYQRLLAAGLASSLKQSLRLSGLTGSSGRHWLAGTPTPTLGQLD